VIYKILIFTITLLIVSACTIPAASSPTPTEIPIIPSATSLPNTPTPSTQVPSWNTYNNGTYGYSLEHPDFYQVTVVSDEHIEIGDKLLITVSNMDPATPLGDGPVIESKADVPVSGYSAQLLTGYIGSIGGNIPQQIRRYVFERDGYFLIITFYALGLHAIEGDVSQIAPLDPNDISLFDTIVTTLRFR
jgi:hypothetical protein